MSRARLAAAALAFWAQGAAAQGNPARDPLLDSIEAKSAACRRVAATTIQRPARSMELGHAAKAYACWKLRLTGSWGNQVLALLERLRSLQDSIKGRKEALDKDLLLYEASRRADGALRARLAGHDAALGELLRGYRSVLETGLRNEMVKSSEKGWTDVRPVVGPRLKSDDYTMVRDETPECVPGKP